MKKNTQHPSKAPSTRYSFFRLIRKETTPSGGVRVSLNLKAVAIYLILTGIFLWMGKSVGLYYFFKEVREYKEITFWQTTLFPLNRSAIRESQGDFQIKQGIQAVEEGKFREALVLLREGVSRSPENPEGRLYLARIYTGWQPNIAIDLLEEGFQRGIRDPESIRLLINLHYQEKSDERVMALTETLLGEDDIDESLIQFILVKRIQSAIATGQLELADQIFRETAVKRSMDGLVLGSDLLLKMGKDTEAIQILNSVLRQFPDENLDPVFAVLFSIFRKNEMWAEGREYALRHSLRDPLKWEPRITLIEFLHRSGAEERRDREVRNLINTHADDEAAMARLASMTASLGLVEPANEIYRVALRNNYAMGSFSLLLIEAYLKNDQAQIALSLIEQIVAENPDWLERATSQFNIIRSIAYFKAGNRDLGELYLNYFNDSRQTTDRQLASASREFIKMDRPNLALRLLAEAHERSPEDERILSELVELQLSIGNADNLGPRLQKLITLRRPGYDKVRNIADKLKSDLFIYTSNRDQLIQRLNEIVREPTDADILLWKEA